MGFEPLMAIRELAELGGASWDWGQVQVEQGTEGWVLRHSADLGRDLTILRPLGLQELHDWADVTERVVFVHPVGAIQQIGPDPLAGGVEGVFLTDHPRPAPGRRLHLKPVPAVVLPGDRQGGGGTLLELDLLQER
jgi:hypothetical protein